MYGTSSLSNNYFILSIQKLLFQLSSVLTVQRLLVNNLYHSLLKQKNSEQCSLLPFKIIQKDKCQPPPQARRLSSVNQHLHLNSDCQCSSQHRIRRQQEFSLPWRESSVYPGEGYIPVLVGQQYGLRLFCPRRSLVLVFFTPSCDYCAREASLLPPRFQRAPPRRRIPPVRTPAREPTPRWGSGEIRPPRTQQTFWATQS